MSQSSTIAQPPVTLFGIGTDVWGGWIRHGLTLGAGVMAEHGLLMSANLSAEEAQVGTGIAMALLTMAWSWWQKRQQRKA